MINQTKQEYHEQFNVLRYDVLKNIKTIAIYGETGSGKTALAYKILSEFEGKKTIYFMKHPKPYLIAQKGYKNLVSLEAIQSLQDCVIYMDEPQLFLSVYDHSSNKIIAKVCSLARQRGITLVISSSDTRVFSKWNESYFDLWLIKDLDYSSVKQGSKIRKAYKDNAMIDPNGLRLAKNDFISESRILSEFNGIHHFELTKDWCDEFSTPYRLEENDNQKDERRYNKE